jgi:nucleotide-binding universal stress UspA family protein
MARDLPIAVGVDGSEPSLRAVDWAADEAALRGAPLRLVYASLWERNEGAHLAEELGGQYIGGGLHLGPAEAGAAGGALHDVLGPYPLGGRGCTTPPARS